MIVVRIRAIVPVLSTLLVLPGVAAAGPDPCADLGTTAICSGNQSAGVYFSEPITTLTVNNLSFDIDPATGVLGIGLSSNAANGSDGPGFIVRGFDGGAGNPGSVLNLTFTSGGLRAIRTVQASGVWARSVGGNGGRGGVGVSTPLPIPLPGIGGIGGRGGDGGGVSVTSNFGQITTSGASAIFAESQGGRGGDGGNGIGLLGFLAIGGTGGAAGHGGRVSVDNSSNLVVTGGEGIRARSAGGAGGNGGIGILSIIGVGGAGAGFGMGGEVKVKNSGSIGATGDGADGIFAQSIGGFAGTAGDAGALFAFGASSESSGPGGWVDVTNSGAISTQGSEAAGIKAQSVGGGGGDTGTGGLAVGLIAVGGSGSAGGSGGLVTVDNTLVTADNTAARIQTIGANSDGIFAESVGGGGGAAGGAVGVGFWAGFALGGAGGSGGAGGDVSVKSVGGEILTKGDLSNGIFAQSLGGGGGSGGFSVAASVGKYGSASVAIGGAGGNGGNAGSLVNVRNSSQIVTEGFNAPAIMAMSTGGGGGAGGFTIAAAAGTDVGIAVGVGGSGGNGGNGGAVTVNQLGGTPLQRPVGSQSDLRTVGSHSDGIFAQSIGGGGGSGGFSIVASGGKQGSISVGVGGSGGSGGSGSRVDVTNASSIQTLGSKSNGILAQSVGGGGGNAGFAVSISIGGTEAVGVVAVAVGGSGGGGGNGGAVTVSNNVANSSAAAITTGGSHAIGIAAQSVGGGGGTAGFSATGVLNTSRSGGNTSLGVSIGGGGGAGGQGGQVDVISGGVMLTAGADSYGILAQSVGGGGGAGGLAVSTIIGLGSNEGSSVDVAISTAIGGAGGAGNTGGVVNVTNKGGITTAGDRAHGIVAQSTGGGGGVGGGAVAGIVVANADTPSKKISIPVSIGGTGGSGNLGGAVTINNVSGARVTTSGLGAHGILAQSIGGGGGDGGGANSFSFFLGSSCHLPLGIGCTSGGEAPRFLWTRPDPSVVKGITLAVGVGGAGGSGNHGGSVTVTNDGTIRTTGAGSSGIVAQSIGHGGGNGGSGAIGLGDLIPDLANFALSPVVLPFSNAGSLTTFSATVGGRGGGSGSGGAITVTNTGLIMTSATSAHGVLAQSIGAGGGNGASGNSGMLGTVAIGGWAGAAGDGGAVTVNNISPQARIVTRQDDSVGILVQSIGGGGGLSTVPVDAPAPGPSSPDPATTRDQINVRGAGGNCSGLICIGGAGGALGNGGSVTITNVGDIATGMTVVQDGVAVTSGHNSRGIWAQSIGGGGGAGLGGRTASLFLDVPNPLRAVSIGGAGGSGGSGGAIVITNQGNITTRGDNAKGIEAESIGGGGGSGGTAAALISIGGTGGSNGSGGQITVTNSGSIVTLGDESQAIYVQSIGGGGGNLTGARAGGGAGGAISPFMAIGGGTGSIGNGGEIIVNNRAGATISTDGDGADGIFAQSIGGGGGDAGASISGLFVFPSLSVGADGGAGGNGGRVTVTNYGSITTNGNAANGIFAQSIGGGGGLGGAAYSAAVQAGHLPNVAIGGRGGLGGDGGDVTVNNLSDGAITINGANGHGVFAQSVGGGGGSGGSSFGLNFSLFVPVAPSISVGGNGGGAGNGGDILVQNDARIVINGDNSTGILAQSVGGGGGIGTASGLGGSSVAVSAIPIFVGGDNGAIGIGGGVTVNNAGTLVINGANSFGIFAQSVGGGGGIASIDGGAAQLNLLTGGSGDGGVITVQNTGSIIVNGSNSYAYFAQSIGGGGGVVNCNHVATPVNACRFSGASGSAGANGFFAGSAGGAGDASALVLSQRGSLIATGLDSVALFAQSDANGSRGDITIDILNLAPDVLSVIAGGSGSGAGIKILGGGDNVLNNYGIITSAPGVAGRAVVGDTGNNTINNFGRVIGSVELGAGLGAFNNASGALFLAGPTINLGGGLMTNDGLFASGGAGMVQSTVLNGGFMQSGTGIWLADFDNSGVAAAADRIDATGTGEVAGELNLNLVNAGFTKPGSGQVILLSTESGLTDTGLTLVYRPSAIANYRLVYPTVNELALAYTIDFARLRDGGLNANQMTIGDYFNRVQLAGGSAENAPIVEALLGFADGQDVADAYNYLSPEAYVARQFATWQSSTRFTQAMLDCRAHGGQVHAARPDRCAWAHAGGSWLHQGSTRANFGYEQQTLSFGGGFQKALNDTWNLGFGLNVEMSWQDSAGFSSGQAQQIQLGAVASARFGDSSLSWALDAGRGLYDVSRLVTLPVPAVATSDSALSFVTARMRVAHTLGGSARYLRPMLDVGAGYLRSHAFQEEGAGAAGLDIRAQGETFFSVTSALEFGSESRSAKSSRVLPFARIGLTGLYAGTSPDLSATLQGAPDGVAPFSIAGRHDDYYADIALGLDILDVGGGTLRLGYLGQFADGNFSQSTVFIRARF